MDKTIKLSMVNMEVNDLLAALKISKFPINAICKQFLNGVAAYKNTNVADNIEDVLKLYSCGMKLFAAYRVNEYSELVTRDQFTYVEFRLVMAPSRSEALKILKGCEPDFKILGEINATCLVDKEDGSTIGFPFPDSYYIDASHGRMATIMDRQGNKYYEESGISQE